MVFFSPDKKSAEERVKRLAKRDKFYLNKRPVLAERQIEHSSGWKTYKLVMVD